jgi:hypothetical protein
MTKPTVHTTVREKIKKKKTMSINHTAIISISYTIHNIHQLQNTQYPSAIQYTISITIQHTLSHNNIHQLYNTHYLTNNTNFEDIKKILNINCVTEIFFLL